MTGSPPLSAPANRDVDVHLCEAGEGPRVQAFLDRHWAKGHVLARDGALFDWQHRRADGRYNVIVAARPGEEDLLGVLGFIPTDRYDPALTPEQTVVWLALWKVRPDAASAGLGLALLRHLTGLHPRSAVGVVGIGPAEHAGMYRALGFRAGELTQYYVAREGCRQFALAQIPAGQATPPARGDARLERVTQADLLGLEDDALVTAAGVAPRKTARYFAERFFGHPTYEYSVHRVRSAAGPGLLAARVASHEGARALRIVDFLGSASVFAAIGPEIQRLMRDADCEYADVWNTGFGASAFAAAGFAPVEREGPVVVPNYFEPFLRKNARIAFALRAPAASAMVIFRADGDQDRPNQPASRG